MEKTVSADLIYTHLYIEGVSSLDKAKESSFEHRDWEVRIFPEILNSCAFDEKNRGIAKSLSPCLLGGFIKPLEDGSYFEIEKTRVAFLSGIYSK